MAGGVIGSLMYAVGFKFKPKGLNEGDKKIKGLTATVTKFGIAAGAAVGAAAIGIGAAALNAAGKFETAMTSMQKATGMTSDQLEATKGIAKNLYAGGFGESWDDLGQSIASVKQITGMTGTALQGATKNAIGLRNEFGFEVSESIRTVDTMMKNFGVTSDQAFNLIAQGKQKGLDFSGEMLDSINEYSNQFVSLGFNANQMFDTLAAGAASGAFNLDKVGDAVKEFNIRAVDGSKTSIEGFKALGLDANKMMQTFGRGGPAAQKAFTQVVQSIAKVKDPVKQNTIAINLFGTQFEDLQSGVITAMGNVQSQFDMTKDSMAEINKIKFTSVGQVFGFVGRQIETYVLIPIGQKLLPYLNQFGQWITSHQGEISAFGGLIADKIGSGIGTLVRWIQSAIPYLQQFGASAGQSFGQLINKGRELWTEIQPVAVLIGETLVQAAESLWPKIQEIGNKIKDVATSFSQWEGFLPTIAGIASAVAGFKLTVGAITLAMKAWTLVTKIQELWTKRATIAQKLFNLATKANVIGLIVAALVGLGVALMVAYKRSDKFRAFVDGMWAGIKSATMAVLNFFKVTIPKYFMIAFNAVTGFLKSWGLVILGVIGGPIFLIAALVYKYWDQIRAVTISVFTAVGSWLSSKWNSIRTTISNTAIAIWNKVKTTWNNLKTSISSAMEGIKSTMSSAWDSIVSAVSGVGEGIKSKMSGAWESVKSTFLSGINWIIGKFNGMISNLNSVSIKNPFNGSEIAGINIPLIPTIDGSHKNGLSYVPWDGYIAKLHEGERVLTANENKAYTPESSPARPASGGTGPVTVSPVINITVEGNADDSTTSNLKTAMHDVVLEIIMSALRSAGLDGA
ncbi:phage tail tape measure protein [Paenibacillus sp. HN-1]|uniref:phage tail tape measure protein n=1 Tax=Paenibacillus TaxID=44249 RepID=UPI001CA8ECE5|nr:MULTISPECIES: phage tail tape measure protein [Paenibacillus]MBY9077281.1 phage tail tape measure protein [Paenibacillus sp. CGMCC 1.18879]MBY9083328.1 phage tail tape measure protein [Paenibacillus sinensis]